MNELRILFMGTPQFGVVPLEFLVNNNYTVVGVYTQQDKVAGRGQMITSSPVKKSALRNNLSIYQPDNLKTEEAVAGLLSLKPDLIITSAYGQILSKKILEIPRFGCINVHPSLLPLYRGVSPVPATLLAGDEFTGVTIMLADPGIDTGPILAQACIPVLSQDTTGTLTEKLSVIGAQLLMDVIPRWTTGQLKQRPQENTAASYCRKIAKEDGEINWQLPAVKIWRQVRAYTPWPGSYTSWQGKKLKILAARPMGQADGLRTGEVVPGKDKEIGFGVKAGDDILGIMAVQYEGKRAMTAADFARGQRGLLGNVLPG
jgi:methionyl-tRNA formyltransferase